MKIDMKDKNTREHTIRLMWITFLLAILLAPAFSQGVMKYSTLSSYEDGSCVLTSRPLATFPDDWGYCYIDDSTISICVLTLNQDITIEMLAPIVEKFAMANISITFTGIKKMEEEEKSYLDYDLEQMGMEYRIQSDADIVLFLTYLQGVESAGYGDLGGYARVDKHFATVFVPSTYRNYGMDGVNCIATHELAHCLGYWHSDNPNDLMYPRFRGSNDEFTEQTAEELYRLHHEGE
jgi:hypothetical protein